jgi:histidyl-tRNA synthetase
MKQADRSGARFALLLEGGTAKLRDLESGEEREVSPDRLAEEIAAT